MSTTSGILGALSQIFAAEKNKAHRELLERELKVAQERLDRLVAENDALKVRLKDYESDVSDSQLGERCPKCREPRMFLSHEEPDPTFGDLGVIREHMACKGCSHTTYRQRKP